MYNRSVVHKTVPNMRVSEIPARRSVNVAKKSRGKSSKNTNQKALTRRPGIMPPHYGQSMIALQKLPRSEQPTSSAMTINCTPDSSLEDGDVVYLGFKLANIPGGMLDRHHGALVDSNQGHNEVRPQNLNMEPPRINATITTNQHPCQEQHVDDKTMFSASEARLPHPSNLVCVNKPVKCSGKIDPEQAPRMPLVLPPSSYTKLSHGASTNRSELSPALEASHPRPQRPFRDASALEAAAEESQPTSGGARMEAPGVPRTVVVPSRGTEPALHRVSDRIGSLRVTKQRKKPRNSQDTQEKVTSTTSQARTAPVVSNIDHAIEMVRVAILSDQFLAEHNHKLNEDHAKEVQAELKCLVRDQETTIIDLKAKQLESNASVTRIVEKAKTNQKFVTGIQADYEKLQKSTAAFQAQSKRMWQDKINEVEAEKQALHREFEATADSLRQSQRKMKAAVDEMYIRLSTSELEKNALSKRLDLQTARYEEKKNKCDKLEGQTLQLIQRVQGELGDSFTAVTRKLDHLQSRSDQAHADGRFDAAMSQLFEKVKELQATPFLTIRDLGDAEGILQHLLEK
jgi:hypothetical protein